MKNILPQRRSRTLVWLAIFVASMTLASAGAAAAAYTYDERNRDVVLQGVTVGDVRIGGMSYTEARQKLLREFEEPLDRISVIQAEGQLFTVTPRSLGFSTDVLDRFAEVRSLNGSLSFFRRVLYRLTGNPLDKTMKVETTFEEKKLDALVGEIAAKVDKAPMDAKPRLVGESIVIDHDQPGFVLDRKASVSELKRSLLAGKPRIILKGEVQRAAVRKVDVTDVLVVKIGDNKLSHYRGDTVVKTYDVATGTSKYPTPKGTFKIVNKRFRPTWVNPAKYKGGWGASLPAKIGPGPGNPLGTRALDLNSPGIRIHGTSSLNSLGFNASHGCIRMSIKDSEELFGLVKVGTPVLIVQTAPYRPMTTKAPSVPEPTAESDASTVPGQPQPSPPPPENQQPAPGPPSPPSA
jgi:lipoprotein-anchoring transpeptidase ErfK/SrfK